MAKNLIPQIAQMLGVALGEEFNVKGAKGADSTIFWFDLDGLHTETCEMADVTLWQLVLGNETIVKLPWKPKEGDEVYTFSFTTHEYNSRFCPHKGVWYVTKWNWAGFPWQIAALDKGWVFRSKQEAEAALPAVAAEMGVEFIV